MRSEDRRGSRALFQERVDRWTRRTLLRPTAIRVRHMTRLWAICYPDGAITFSRALLDHHAAFQDLVIVHELIHLVIPNHGKSFVRALAVYLPDWRAIARLAPGTPAALISSRMVRDAASRSSHRQYPSVDQIRDLTANALGP